MGLLEFLEWCEDLKIQPVLAVYAGYSMRQEHVEPTLQPALITQCHRIVFRCSTSKPDRSRKNSRMEPRGYNPPMRDRACLRRSVQITDSHPAGELTPEPTLAIRGSASIIAERDRLRKGIQRKGNQL